MTWSLQAQCSEPAAAAVCFTGVTGWITVLKGAPAHAVVLPEAPQEREHCGTATWPRGTLSSLTSRAPDTPVMGALGSRTRGEAMVYVPLGWITCLPEPRQHVILSTNTCLQLSLLGLATSCSPLVLLFSHAAAVAIMSGPTVTLKASAAAFVPQKRRYVHAMERAATVSSTHLCHVPCDASCPLCASAHTSEVMGDRVWGPCYADTILRVCCGRGGVTCPLCPTSRVPDSVRCRALARLTLGVAQTALPVDRPRCSDAKLTSTGWRTG